MLIFLTGGLKTRLNAVGDWGERIAQAIEGIADTTIEVQINGTISITFICRGFRFSMRFMGPVTLLMGKTPDGFISLI